MNDDTKRPWGLTAKDLENVPPATVAARAAFVESYCSARGWPTDPARLSREQLFEIIEHPGWPRP